MPITGVLTIPCYRWRRLRPEKGGVPGKHAVRLLQHRGAVAHCGAPPAPLLLNWWRRRRAHRRSSWCEQAAAAAAVLQRAATVMLPQVLLLLPPGIMELFLGSL